MECQPLSAILLDTHTLIWLFEGSPRLSESAKTLIRQKCSEEAAFISAITPWEIGNLVVKSRLTLRRDIDGWISEVFDDYGIGLAALSPDIAINSTRLPGAFHNDPADRIIVATARSLNAVLVTADRAILDYGDLGHVQTYQAC